MQPHHSSPFLDWIRKWNRRKRPTKNTDSYTQVLFFFLYLCALILNASQVAVTNILWAPNDWTEYQHTQSSNKAISLSFPTNIFMYAVIKKATFVRPLWISSRKCCTCCTHSHSYPLSPKIIRCIFVNSWNKTKHPNFFFFTDHKHFFLFSCCHLELSHHSGIIIQLVQSN